MVTLNILHRHSASHALLLIRLLMGVAVEEEEESVMESCDADALMTSSLSWGRGLGLMMSWLLLRSHEGALGHALRDL